METFLIVSLILFVLFLILMFKVVGKVFKIVMKVMSLLTLIMFIVMFFVSMDVADMKEKLPTEDKLFLFVNEQGVQSAYAIGTMDRIPDAISDVSDYNQYYKNDDFSELKDKYYKILVIKESFFDSVKEINFSDLTITKSEIDSILGASDPNSKMVDLILEKRGVGPEYRSSIEDGVKDARGLLYFTMFGTMLQGDSPLLLLDKYKNNQMVVYPETITFKFVKYMPFANKLVS